MGPDDHNCINHHCRTCFPPIQLPKSQFMRNYARTFVGLKTVKKKIGFKDYVDAYYMLDTTADPIFRKLLDKYIEMTNPKEMLEFILDYAEIRDELSDIAVDDLFYLFRHARNYIDPESYRRSHMCCLIEDAIENSLLRSDFIRLVLLKKMLYYEFLGNRFMGYLTIKHRTRTVCATADALRHRLPRDLQRMIMRWVGALYRPEHIVDWVDEELEIN